MEISGRIHGLSAHRRERALGSSYSQIFKVPTLKSYSLLVYNTSKLKSVRHVILCTGQQQQQEEKHGRSLREMINSIPEWADEIKERGMLQRKKLYDHEEWLRHRSSTRHIRHVLTSLSSRVILSLIPPVCIFTVIAAAVAAYNTAVSREWFPSFMPLLHTSSLPHQLTAPALALLLVFRTDASYSRYEEGRRTWTDVLSGTKDFARQVNAWIQHPSDTPLKDNLLLYIMAFPVALKCYIIYGSDIKNDLGSLLQEDDLAVVLSSQHQPNCIIQFISESLRQAQLDEDKRNILDSHISQFNKNISTCERLIRTPIPLSYTRLTSRFLVLWHITLPIILWDECDWIVVLATFFSAASLFCIEEVGALIEEPFPMLALDRMCELAHDNIREMIKLQNSIGSHLHDKRASLLDRSVSNGTGRRNRDTSFKL